MHVSPFQTPKISWLTGYELDINHCNCELDDIRIFEVAMDADEIMNLN